mmetsp:Transcript_97245/g.167579  ORF Transcript_97245/g.167579 Transcript_97245/m.167579 type:complete len:241 (-) Transcript_97245:521-1243(-)
MMERSQWRARSMWEPWRARSSSIWVIVRSASSSLSSLTAEWSTDLRCFSKKRLARSSRVSPRPSLAGTGRWGGICLSQHSFANRSNFCSASATVVINLAPRYHSPKRELSWSSACWRRRLYSQRLMYANADPGLMDWGLCSICLVRSQMYSKHIGAVINVRFAAQSSSTVWIKARSWSRYSGSARGGRTWTRMERKESLSNWRMVLRSWASFPSSPSPPAPSSSASSRRPRISSAVDVRV